MTLKPPSATKPDKCTLFEENNSIGWANKTHESTVEAALSYFEAGLPVIPIVPGKKMTAVKWDFWLENLCEASIRKYWQSHPGHGIGFIVPENLVVFDADTPIAVAALYQIEDSFDLTPLVIVKTRRGEHHYFQIAPGTKVKTRSIDTKMFPLGIDIKAKRSMVLLP